MTKFPRPEEIRNLLLNPPTFMGQVMRGGRENQSATIRHPMTGQSIRATVVGGDIFSGNVPVFAVAGGYIASGTPQIRQSIRRDGGLISVPQPQVSPAPEPPVNALLVHLFIISEIDFQSGSGTGYGRSGKHHYYLTDGTNLLKVFTSELYRMEESGRPRLNFGDRIMNALRPTDQAIAVDWWAIDVNTIVIQFPTMDWSTYDGSDTNTIGKQVVTVLVKDWAIVLTDLQQSTVAFEPIVYPDELQPYVNWLTPQHRSDPESAIRVEIPIYGMVNATYGEGAFRLEWGDNVGANMIPVQVQYKFRESDLLGDPINGYGANVEGDYFPFPPGAKVRSVSSPPPLDLNAFERAWTIATPTSSDEVVIPAVNFGGMSSDSVTYTDTLTLYDIPDGNPYTIGQIKSGAYNPEGLGGSKTGEFRTSPEFANIGLVNHLRWLGSRAVLA